MYQYLIFALLFFIALTSPTSLAGDRFEQLSINDGLSQNTITSLMQDQQGFLWIGTQDGLNRYDGYQFKTFHHNPNQNNTLSDDYITALHQDKAGNIWIGTFTGGLNRYNPDTETFTNYTHNNQNQNSLSGNQVTTIISDQQGRIWTGTWGGGITILDTSANQYTRLTHDRRTAKSLSHNLVWKIFKDRQNRIWVGTYGGGLNLYDETIDGFIHYKHDQNNPNSLSSDKIWSLAQNQAGQIWIGTEGGGLNRFDPINQQFTHYQHDASNPHSLSHNIVRDIIVDQEDNLWVGTYGGLNKLSFGSEQFIRYSKASVGTNGLSGNVIFSLLQSRDGAIWVGLQADGLNKYNPQQAQFVHMQHDRTNPDSLNSNSVWSFLEDSAGTLWVGTDEGGLNQYDPINNRFIAYKHDPNDPNSIISNRVWALAEDKQGYIWIGTYGSGVSRLDPKTKQFIHYQHNENNNNSLSNNRVMSIFIDKNDTLWVGTYIGLNRFNANSGTFTHFKYDPMNSNTISNDAILSIDQSKNGHMLIGTYSGGFNIIDPKTRQVTRYQTNKFDQNSINNNTVMDSFEDSDGFIWLATYGGGLNRLDPNTQQITHYDQEQGLMSNSLYSILTDEAQNFWMSTNQGLIRYDRQNQTFTNFNVDDGLQSNEFNSGAAFKSTKTGKLYFGGINGYNQFDPQTIKRQQSPIQVVFTQLNVFNKAVKTHQKNGADIHYSRQAINRTKEINLSYKDAHFSLEFSALNFVSNHNIEFAYQLIGWDEDWINTTAQLRLATYTNIPAGHYTLKVKARNRAGDWSDNIASLDIHIAPAPWKTTWAYATYMLILGGLISTVVWQRQRQYNRLKASKDAIDQLNQQLEQRVAERTENLSHTIDKLKQTQQQLVESEKLASLGSLVAGIAHEINTPLGISITASSQIEHMLEQLDDKVAQQKLTKLALEQFSQDTKQGLSLLNQNLNRASILVQDFKSLAVEPNDDDIRAFELLPLLHQVAQTQQAKLNERHVELSIQCPHSITIQSIPHAIANILNQLIENSLLHGFDTADHGKINIGVSLEQSGPLNTLKIDYHDDGNGVDEQTLSKLFEPFYTTKRNQHCTGLGMLIIHNIIVHQLNGKIRCESELGKGMQIHIQLPMP